MATRRATSNRFPSRLAVVGAAFLLAAALQAPRPPLAAAQEPPPPWLVCDTSSSTGNYTANSTYQANIDMLAATLPRSTSSSPLLYARDSVGSVPDVVYALALCRGDANASACERCVADAFGGAQRRCPLTKDVLIFYDLCQLRFSNRHFFQEDDYYINSHILLGPQVVSAAAAPEFDAAVGRLINATAGYVAAANSSRRFATGEEGTGNKMYPKIYALSQCTPERTLDICQACLTTLITQMPKSFSGRIGGVLGVWCTIRYEVHPFFSGRPLLQLPDFVATTPTRVPPVTTRQDKSNKTGTILATVMPTSIALLVITVIYIWRRRPERPHSTNSDDIQAANMLLLDLPTLRVATQDFADSNMLGRGGFGIVYKGVLPEGQEIAVKRLCQSSKQGLEELKSELVLVAKLHHNNLVRLIGACLQENEKILVYEYLPNRSLDTILFDPERSKKLDWAKRFKIINGIARGLQYLHDDSQLKIIHRDLKAGNILLDSDYIPKISDFGLAKIFGSDQSKYVTHRVAGTYGYMAPEYALRGLYSAKSDVFSFGVLVLEIITGRRNIGSYDSEEDVDLLDLVLEHWTKGNAIKLLDSSLSDNPPIEQMLKCIHIGLLCVQRRPTARPTMSWVNIMLRSSTVCLPPLSRSSFFFQDVILSDS